MPRGSVRPRYGRIGAALSSVLITGVTLLAGIGVVGGNPPEPSTVVPAAQVAAPDPTPTATPASTLRDGVRDGTPDPTALPGRSGHGKRVVFDISSQRVWLVGHDGTAARSYLVSGSVTDNLRPGSYEVYSTSRWAVGVDDSGVMEYFVRFAHGPRAAIGFHSIPTKYGEPLQTEKQLGTPRSHGCIRQSMKDAKALWDFAPVGTTVVVLA